MKQPAPPGTLMSSSVYSSSALFRPQRADGGDMRSWMSTPGVLDRSFASVGRMAPVRITTTPGVARMPPALTRYESGVEPPGQEGLASAKRIALYAALTALLLFASLVHLEAVPSFSDPARRWALSVMVEQERPEHRSAPLLVVGEREREREEPQLAEQSEAGQEVRVGQHAIEEPHSRRHPRHPFKELVAEQARHRHLLDREWKPGNLYRDDSKYWVRLRGNKIVEMRTSWPLGGSHMDYRLRGYNTLLNDTMAHYSLPDITLNINCHDEPRPGRGTMANPLIPFLQHTPPPSLRNPAFLELMTSTRERLKKKGVIGVPVSLVDGAQDHPHAGDRLGHPEAGGEPA